MKTRHYLWNGPRAGGLALGGAIAVFLTAATVGPSGHVADWIRPGEGKVLPQIAEYKNAYGTLQVYNASGPIATKGNPFFEPLLADGRACVTCHQPADAMSLAAETARERWDVTQGHDPLFSTIDGANCPDLPRADRASHSLLLNKGLFRISMPWPPRDAAGKAITPEFDIEVVSDPTGCNLSARYGLASADPQISVFRRPRVAANLKYVEPPVPLGLWHVRAGKPFEIDPLNGNRLQNTLMADGRLATLRLQMSNAMSTHMEAHQLPGGDTFERIRDFELQLYAAQVSDDRGGSLQIDGAYMGPQQLAKAQPAVLGSFPMRPQYPGLEAWRTKRTLAQLNRPSAFPNMRPLPDKRPGEDRETPEQKAFRDSVVRGYDIYMYRKFLIRNVSNLNRLVGNPVQQTCAVCHNMQETGLDTAPGYLDLGTTNAPTSIPAPELPLFRITCRADAPPHPYLGRLIYTRDPGRALVTGKCADVGQITAQQLRGIASRAPYFSDGSAKTLMDVVEFYDRRFRIGLNPQEKQDLVNFMSVL